MDLQMTLKTKFPHIIVMMGGPNFPLQQEHQESFLQSRPAIDYYIEKEGRIGILQSNSDIAKTRIRYRGSEEEMELGNIRAITK